MLLLLSVAMGIVGLVGVVIAVRHGDLDGLGLPSLLALFLGCVFSFISVAVILGASSYPVAWEARHSALIVSVQNGDQLINAAARLAIVKFNTDLATYQYWDKNIWTGVYLPPIPRGVTRIEG